MRDDIQREYYDSTFHGLDLAARAAAADARVDQARSLDDIMVSIAQFSLELGDSHTFFLPPSRTVTIAYGWDMLMVGDSCFVTSIQRGSDAEAQGVKVGDAVLAVNGHPPTRGTSWQLAYVYHTIRPQPGLRVTVQSPGGEPRQLDIAAKVRQHPQIVDLTGADGGRDIWKLVLESDNAVAEMRQRYVDVEDSVLIWKIPTFAILPGSMAELLEHARKKRALVLDLRGNGGGQEETMLELLGALFEKDLSVATIRERHEATPLVANGVGRNRFAGALVVLVDSRSASASEIIARTIQLSNRGKVVGDRTAGAVMRSRTFSHALGQQTAIFYGTSIAVADVVMPDGGRLEGVGVTPNEFMLPTGHDLAAKRDPALARALALVGVTASPERAAALFREN